MSLVLVIKFLSYFNSYLYPISDPPALSIEPDTGFMEVNEDDSITIGCIPKGNPLPQISWSKRVSHHCAT